MRYHDLARYSLWCGVAVTAAANRRAYRMTTTWLPHFAANTLSLLLPDLLRVALPSGHPAQSQPPGSRRRLLRDTLATTVRDNPAYVLYAAPLAAGYLLSAPWLNIYKGELGELSLAGFGLDALPHATTAYALTALVGETLAAAAELAAPDDSVGDILRWLDERGELVSGAALVLATLVWELGEYRIHRHELVQRGSAEAINMQWSMADTVTDCLANAAGWLIAVALQRSGR
jgi:hypothetical protein